MPCRGDSTISRDRRTRQGATRSHLEHHLVFRPRPFAASRGRCQARLRSFRSHYLTWHDRGPAPHTSQSHPLRLASNPCGEPLHPCSDQLLRLRGRPRPGRRAGIPWLPGSRRSRAELRPSGAGAAHLLQVPLRHPGRYLGYRGWGLRASASGVRASSPASEWGTQPDFDGLHPTGQRASPGRDGSFPTPSLVKQFAHWSIRRGERAVWCVWCVWCKSLLPACVSVCCCCLCPPCCLCLRAARPPARLPSWLQCLQCLPRILQ